LFQCLSGVGLTQSERKTTLGHNSQKRKKRRNLNKKRKTKKIEERWDFSGNLLGKFWRRTQDLTTPKFAKGWGGPSGKRRYRTTRGQRKIGGRS